MKPGSTDITCPIGEFITAGARERLFTGILFSEGTTPLYLHFRQGQLINIESWDPFYNLAAFALQTGLITREEYDRLRTAQIETGERLVELLKKESRTDHTTILRLHETFAYVTLLHLIRENSDFSAVEGAVTADPVLIEAISPERFTERLTPLVDGKRCASLLTLWQSDLMILDPACGLESGPAAAAFLHTGRRFPEQIAFIERTLASEANGKATAQPDHTGILAILLSFFLVLLLAGLTLLYADRRGQAHDERTNAAQQIDILRGELIGITDRLAAMMRVR